MRKTLMRRHSSGSTSTSVAVVLFLSVLATLGLQSLLYSLDYDGALIHNNQELISIRLEAEYTTPID